MIATPLIIWFFAPLLFISGAISVGVAVYKLAEIVQHHKKVKHLNRERAEEILSLKELGSRIKRNMQTGDVPRYKGFLKKEKGILYGGEINQKGELDKVTQIDYTSIDSNLNRELNNLDDDKVLLI